jgi:membrane-associated phospholipid phosphatase
MRFAAVLLALLAPLPAMAESKLETAGTATAIALPVIAGGITLLKHDRKGTLQLFIETALTVGTAYGLKQIVHEQRPDGSDYKSFPSETTALGASGAAFLWGRYGWEYGLPAYAATGFVAYSRVESRQHHWYDTLASGVLASGYGYFVTTPLKRRYNINTQLTPFSDGGAVRLSYDF